MDPVWCRKRIWIADIAAIIKGNMKCKAKNRFKVALPTAKPPHNQQTISGPIYGMADKRLVITVAAQKLI